MRTLLLALALAACGPKTAPPPSNTTTPTTPPSSGKAADGASCLSAADCTSNMCEGQGCGADAPGKCVSAERICTQDMQSYCGCDGKDFFGSGTCPGRRYASHGACAK
jgi:hypothetical protein